MHVRLGALVLDKNAVTVGHIDQLIIDPRSRRIVQLVAKQGRLRTRDVIIDRPMADHVDAEGHVHLNITEQEVNQLREFFTVDYTPPGQPSEFSWTQSLATPLGGPRTTITDTSTRYSTIADDLRIVNKGMDVKGSDFEKFGEIEDIEFDPDVGITGFTVRTGRLHHEHRSFPVTEVAGLGVDYIRVKMTSAEALAVTPDANG